jgi:uncharacterized protein (TIGR03435 family)
MPPSGTFNAANVDRMRLRCSAVSGCRRSGLDSCLLKLKEVKHESEFEWLGSVAGGSINGDGLAGKNISMPVLAQRLSRYLQKPVFDQTGLKGFFDFRFEYAIDDAQPDVTSCILTSLRGLGLKLNPPSQGPVETIVIDHAEKPSAN